MSLGEDFRAFLTELMNGLSDFMEGGTLHFNFDFLPGINVAAYVLFALGLFTVARRRRIHNAWLAWVPGANLWLLGCISDQYRYVTRGQERNRRTLLLILGIVDALLKTVLFVAMLWGLGGFLQGLESAADLLRGSWKLLEYAAWGLVVSAFGSVVLLFKAFALYDLYCSCSPKKKNLFTVVSVLGYLFNVTLAPALLVFLCRNKEEGMPPRISD